MRRIIPVVAAALALAACGTDPAGSEEPDDAETSAVCDDELLGALSRWSEAGFSGSIAITSEGSLECEAGFGLADAAREVPNTAETVFAIGSVSKSFTAAAVLDLVEAGALALDDRAGELLPGLGGPAAETTVEQLLLHTSGLSGSHGEDHVPLDREAAIAALSELGSAFEAGTAFGYSNSGYTLLALIVDEVSGSGYREHMAAEILRLPDSRERIGGFWDGEPAPRGDRAVGLVDGAPAASLGGFEGPHWAMEGNGDLAMTAPELAAWTAALFEGEVITPEAVELLTGTAFDQGDGVSEVPGWVALDETAYGVPLYTASGGGGDTGHEAVAVWLPRTRQSLAVTSNTSEVTASELLDAIGPALAAGEPPPAPDTGVEVDPAELAAAEGTYTLDSGSVFTVTAAEDRLEVAADGADAIDALFTPTGGFTAEDVERHEAAVAGLLAGETEAGREEREALESDLGPLGEITTLGTVVEEGELRTYVTIEAEKATLAWYAVDEHGGVEAVLLDPGPPVFTLVPAGEGEYRPERLDGAGRGVRVSFDGEVMTVDGPEGPVQAHRSS